MTPALPPGARLLDRLRRVRPEEVRMVGLDGRVVDVAVPQSARTRWPTVVQTVTSHEWVRVELVRGGSVAEVVTGPEYPAATTEAAADLVALASILGDVADRAARRALEGLAAHNEAVEKLLAAQGRLAEAQARRAEAEAQRADALRERLDHALAEGAGEDSVPWPELLGLLRARRTD